MRRWSSASPRGKTTTFPMSVEELKLGLPERGNPASSERDASNGGAGEGLSSLYVRHALLRSAHEVEAIIMPAAALTSQQPATDAALAASRAAASIKDAENAEAADIADDAAIVESTVSAEAAESVGYAEAARSDEAAVSATSAASAESAAEAKTTIAAESANSAEAATALADRAAYQARARLSHLTTSPRKAAVKRTRAKRVAHTHLSPSPAWSTPTGSGRVSFSRRATETQREATVGGHHA